MVQKITHDTHKHVLKKFSLILSVFLAYFVFVVVKFGVKDGFAVSWLTWSFFVLCTPVADAGLLLDFPIRMISSLRMLYTELMVWLFAVSLNVIFIARFPGLYQRTKILSFFEHILENPFPMWSIIVLSGIGTFLSVQFGDELLDVIRHSDREFHRKHNIKHQMILIVSIFVLTLIVYSYLLREMGIGEI